MFTWFWTWSGPLVGDVWLRGLVRPEHLLTAMKEDFWILVAGCMMKYIRLEKPKDNGPVRPRVVKAFNHGIDGVACISGNPFRDVYALAEKRARPRIFFFQIQKTEARSELEPQYMHSIRRTFIDLIFIGYTTISTEIILIIVLGTHSWDIRTMEFITKDLLVVLLGFPVFTVMLFKWASSEELLNCPALEPNLFSRLLVRYVSYYSITYCFYSLCRCFFWDFKHSLTKMLLAQQITLIGLSTDTTIYTSMKAQPKLIWSEQ